jgi:hypothetical protein
MRRAVAFVVLAAILAVLSVPVLAGNWGNEFYPGDAPPYACQAGGGQGTAGGKAQSGIGQPGSPDNGASGGNIDQADKDCG